MVTIIFILFFLSDSTRIFYLTDLKYNSPYCYSNFYHIIDNETYINHYKIPNIMGTVSFSNDPLIDTLNINIYIGKFIEDNNTLSHKIFSCELCRGDERFCGRENLQNYNVKSNISYNYIEYGDLFVSQDIDINFRITARRHSSNYDFISINSNALETVYDLYDSSIKKEIINDNGLIYSSIRVPIKELLEHNNDNIMKINCNDSLDIITQLIVSIKDYNKIQKDIILSNIEIRRIFEDYYQLSSNRICIPQEQLLSNYDCGISNIYKVINYKIQNCLLPDRNFVSKNSYSDYSNDKSLNESNRYGDDMISMLMGVKEDFYNCSIHERIYYDYIILNNFSLHSSLNFLNAGLVKNGFCNISFQELLKKTIIDKYYIDICDYHIRMSDYFIVELNPWYLLYKESIIAYFNYYNCKRKYSTIDLEENFKSTKYLIQKSFDILSGSCEWMSTLNIDLEVFNDNIFKLKEFNNKGIENLCNKCILTEIIKGEDMVLQLCSKLSIILENEGGYHGWQERIKKEKSDSILNKINLLNKTLINPFIDHILIEFLEEEEYYKQAPLLLTFILVIFTIICFIFIVFIIQKLLFIFYRERVNRSD